MHFRTKVNSEMFQNVALLDLKTALNSTQRENSFSFEGRGDFIKLKQVGNSQLP